MTQLLAFIILVLSGGWDIGKIPLDHQIDAKHIDSIDETFLIQHGSYDWYKERLIEELEKKPVDGGGGLGDVLSGT